MHEDALMGAMDELADAVIAHEENIRIGKLLQVQWDAAVKTRPAFKRARASRDTRNVHFDLIGAQYAIFKSEPLQNHCLVGNGTNKCKTYSVKFTVEPALRLLDIYMAARMGRNLVIMKDIIYPKTFTGEISPVTGVCLSLKPDAKMKVNQSEMSFGIFISKVSDKMQEELNSYKILPESDIGFFLAKQFDLIFEHCKELLLKHEEKYIPVIEFLATTTVADIEIPEPKEPAEAVVETKAYRGFMGRLKTALGIKL